VTFQALPEWAAAAAADTAEISQFDVCSYDFTTVFAGDRAAWQAQCRDFLGADAEWAAAAAAAPDTAAGLRRVLGCLAGAEASLVAATASWPELLAAQLLHVYPGLRPQVVHVRVSAEMTPAENGGLDLPGNHNLCCWRRSCCTCSRVGEES